MCAGDVYELSCGHLLVHIRTECERGPCARPGTGGAGDDGARGRHYLADTCAACDPDFRTSQLGRAYRARQTELAGRLAKAVRARRADEVGRLHVEMDDLRRRTNDAIGEARHRMVAASAAARPGGSGVEVEFPGGAARAADHQSPPGYTSRWVGGKCVWELEDAGEAEKIRSERRRERERERRRSHVPHRQSLMTATAPASPVTPGTPRAGIDSHELLSRALDEQRRRVAGKAAAGEGGNAEKAAKKKYREPLAANGGGPDDDLDDHGDDDRKEDEKPFWYRAFPPVKSPRAVEFSYYHANSKENSTIAATILAGAGGQQQQAPHPLRHKKKIASWLPTEEEMDRLAARLSLSDDEAALAGPDEGNASPAGPDEGNASPARPRQRGEENDRRQKKGESVRRESRHSSRKVGSAGRAGEGGGDTYAIRSKQLDERAAVAAAKAKAQQQQQCDNEGDDVIDDDDDDDDLWLCEADRQSWLRKGEVRGSGRPSRAAV